MLDRDESALHEVELSIYGRAMLDKPRTVLCDIRDSKAVDSVFRERRPQVVFHAAALKQLTFFWPQVFGGRTPDLITTKTSFLTEAIKRAELTRELSITSRDLLRDLASEIEWAKVSQIAPTDYLSQLSERTAKPRINAEQIAKVHPQNPSPALGA